MGFGVRPPRPARWLSAKNRRVALFTRGRNTFSTILPPKAQRKKSSRTIIYEFVVCACLILLHHKQESNSNLPYKYFDLMLSTDIYRSSNSEKKIFQFYNISLFIFHKLTLSASITISRQMVKHIQGDF